MNIDSIIGTKSNIDGLEYSSGMSIENFIKSSTETDSSKKVASVEKSNSIDMSQTIYLKPIGSDETKTVADQLADESGISDDNRRNKMIVAAGTTTTEDYGKMLEDGFSMEDSSDAVIVTETDKIKAVLAKAGVDVSVYGDDLSTEQLEKITGSAAVAASIEQQFKAYDLPLTGENAKDTTKAISHVESIAQIDEGTKVYLLKNDFAPTIENVYKAAFSGQTVSTNTISETEMREMQQQINQVIESAGKNVDEESVGQSKWLIENDIDLTATNLTKLEELNSIADSFDGYTTDDIAQTIAEAIYQGKSASQASLSIGNTIFEKAQNALDIVSAATDEQVADLVMVGESVTIDNLAKLQIGQMDVIPVNDVPRSVVSDGTISAGISSVDTVFDGSVSENATLTEGTTSLTISIEIVTAQRKLQEARLSMTYEANLSLLRKGVSIDTKPLEELVDLLKNQENSYYNNLLSGSDIEVTEEKVSSFKYTIEAFESMKMQPAYVLDIGSSEMTAGEIYTAGAKLQSDLESASRSYETLMTSPRSDLGDSISKAFQNTDDILSDLNLEFTESNRRAVRILGYNQTEITESNIVEVKAADEQMQRAFKNMTPAVTLEMIRKNISPMDMTMSQLNETAESIRSKIADDDTERFSKYLWKLEKDNGITQEERESYIGIYRLISQVEKTDGAAVGALINEGADITMKNLLQAVRTSHKNGIDYAVDDDFGGAVSTSEGAKIDDQIMTAYSANAVSLSSGQITSSKTDSEGSSSDHISPNKTNVESSSSNQVSPNKTDAENSCSDHISSYNTNCIKDILENISPQDLKNLGDSWEDMTPEQLKEAVSNGNIYGDSKVSSEENNAENIDVNSQYENQNQMQNDLKNEQKYISEKLSVIKEVATASQDVYSFLERYDVKCTAINLAAASRMIKNPSQSVKELMEKGKQAAVQEMLEQTIEQFGESLKTPEDLAEAQETLAETAAHVMDGMIMEDKSVTSLDIRQMKVLGAQFKIAASMSKQESFVIPVETENGVTGVSLKIVRGKEEKGKVDIFMDDENYGKIAASFDASKETVAGTIAVSSDKTKSFMEQNLSAFINKLNDLLSEKQGIKEDSVEEDRVKEDRVRVVYIDGLTEERFMSRESVPRNGAQDTLINTMRDNLESATKDNLANAVQGKLESTEQDTSLNAVPDNLESDVQSRDAESLNTARNVQTRVLYSIAESFITFCKSAL